MDDNGRWCDRLRIRICGMIWIRIRWIGHIRIRMDGGIRGLDGLDTLGFGLGFKLDEGIVGLDEL